MFYVLPLVIFASKMCENVPSCCRCLCDDMMCKKRARDERIKNHHHCRHHLTESHKPSTITITTCNSSGNDDVVQISE